MDNIYIKQASIQHLDKIAEIENSLNIRNLSYSSLKNDLESTNTIYLVLLDNESIIGYIGLEPLVDHADITGIAVLNEYRKKGLASYLLNTAIEKCREINLDNIFLEVRTSNLPAINLYKKLGFKKISIRNNYYSNGEDALIFVLNLK
jgi:ribosomal-protein-alanine N-acetyltransferase